MSETKKDPLLNSLNEISCKLNAITSLLIRVLTQDSDFGQAKKGKHGTGDLTRYLASFGIDPKEISAIIGIPSTSVKTQLTPSRKK